MDFAMFTWQGDPKAHADQPEDDTLVTAIDRLFGAMRARCSFHQMTFPPTVAGLGGVPYVLSGTQTATRLSPILRTWGRSRTDSMLRRSAPPGSPEGVGLTSCAFDW